MSIQQISNALGNVKSIEPHPKLIPSLRELSNIVQKKLLFSKAAQKAKETTLLIPSLPQTWKEKNRWPKLYKDEDLFVHSFNDFEYKILKSVKVKFQLPQDTPGSILDQWDETDPFSIFTIGFAKNEIIQAIQTCSDFDPNTSADIALFAETEIEISIFRRTVQYKNSQFEEEIYNGMEGIDHEELVDLLEKFWVLRYIGCVGDIVELLELSTGVTCREPFENTFRKRKAHELIPYIYCSRGSERYDLDPFPDLLDWVSTVEWPDDINEDVFFDEDIHHIWGRNIQICLFNNIGYAEFWDDLVRATVGKMDQQTHADKYGVRMFEDEEIMEEKVLEYLRGNFSEEMFFI